MPDIMGSREQRKLDIPLDAYSHKLAPDTFNRGFIAITLVTGGSDAGDF